MISQVDVNNILLKYSTFMQYKHCQWIQDLAVSNTTLGFEKHDKCIVIYSFQASIQSMATIGPPAKRWWVDRGPLLYCYCFVGDLNLEEYALFYQERYLTVEHVIITATVLMILQDKLYFFRQFQLARNVCIKLQKNIFINRNISKIYCLAVAKLCKT